MVLSKFASKLKKPQIKRVRKIIEEQPTFQFSNVFRKIWNKYNHWLEIHPKPTNIATAGVLFFAGDVLSQVIEHQQKTEPSKFEWDRALRMTLFGVIFFGPSSYYWYKWLDKTFSPAKANLIQSVALAKVKQQPKISIELNPTTLETKSVNVVPATSTTPTSTPSTSAAMEAADSVYMNSKNQNYLLQAYYNLEYRVLEWVYAPTTNTKSKTTEDTKQETSEDSQQTWKEKYWTPKMRAVLVKVFLDETVYSNIYIIALFVICTLLEGKRLKDVEEKIEGQWLSTYLADLSVWPVAQYINFFYVPARLRIVYISALSLFWNAFLSKVQNGAHH